MGTGAEGTRQRGLVISLSDPTMDARIQRQVRFLSSSYEVVVAAAGAALYGVEFHELRPSTRGSSGVRLDSAARIGLRLSGQSGRAHWTDAGMRRWHDELRTTAPVHAVIVNDLYAVPVALLAGAEASVICDLHEHWTSDSASWTRWQRLSMRGAHEWIVADAIPRTAGMITVSRARKALRAEKNRGTERGRREARDPVRTFPKGSDAIWSEKASRRPDWGLR